MQHLPRIAHLRNFLLTAFGAATLIALTIIGNVKAQTQHGAASIADHQWAQGGNLMGNKTFTTRFEVTIRQRAELRAPYMVAGQLKISVAPSGAFTGHITPLRDENGNLIPGVLYRANDAGLTLDADSPATLEVTGSLQNHSISLTIKLPDDKYIHGVGTSVVNLNELPGGTLDKSIAGSAVGTEAGDSGDWGNSCIPPIPCFYVRGMRICIKSCG